MTGSAFDLRFAFEGIGFSLIRFFIGKFDRKAHSGTSAALFAVMFVYSSRNVGCGAGVKSTISAP